MAETRAQIVNAALAIAGDPAALYDELINCNGTTQNMIYRRLTGEQLDALERYADTQDVLPFSNVNHIASDARDERRRNPR